MATPVTGAPGVQLTTPNLNQQQPGPIPWRTATLRKVNQAAQDSGTIGTATQLFNRVMEGTGYLESVDLELVVTTAANAAAVAYAADGPWNAFSSVVFKDINSDLVNLTGYGLYLVNLYAGNGDKNLAISTDTNVYNAVTGAVGTGGSFRASLRIPLAINSRSLIGALGNQDRAVKYEVRSDVSAGAVIYSVLPTAAGAFTLNRHLNFSTVPTAQGPGNVQQQQFPPAMNVLHMITELTSEANPASASTINHFLRSIGNTIRLVILVFRDSTGARSDLMLPTKITLRVGDDTVFSESGSHRRQLMFKRYGFDAPLGVLVYDWISDFGNIAGFELGDDWLATRDVPYAQFECTYPTFASTPGTLKVITDSLVIPAGTNILSMV